MDGDVFEREIRFGVVMYGGVSLAIYMNGIAQELLRMVRATAAEGDPADGKFRWRVDDPALDGTERIYRRLGAELKARFVVDIISGTSAGGINGIFLAKALAHNRPLDQLRTLWVQEGDVARLLNDKGSVRGGVPAELAENPPASVLSGNRFYWELLDAMEEMDSARPAHDLAGSKRAPYVDEIDLYVTATDFQGAKLPLKLFDKTIEEPVHRKLFHFRYRKDGEADPEHDDLSGKANPMLAFAARCTASFPAAFSPFKLEDIDAALANHPAYANRVREAGSQSPDWKKFFTDYPEGYAKRYFVDGGYLDNKPFEAASTALASRHHVLLPVERKLLYIEPDPERRGSDKEIPRPDVLAALTAVVSLPRVETIRAEIDEITRRNRVYDRASILAAAVDDDARQREQAGRGARTEGGPAANWALKDLQDLVADHGVAYGGYHRLKVSGITDWLAQCLFSALAPSPGETTLDDVRARVVAWRDAKYKAYYTPEERKRRGDSNPQPPLPLLETRMLIDLDVAYRLRRLEFVRLKLREQLDSPGAVAQVPKLAGLDEKVSDAERSAARAPLIELQKGLEGVHRKLAELNRACMNLSSDLPAPPSALLKPIGAALADFKGGKGDQKTAGALLDALAQTVAAQLKIIGDECRAVFSRAPKQTTPYFIRTRETLLRLFVYYDDFDLVSFPLVYCLGTQELARVDVLRVSAADTKLSREGAEKLAGIRLGHFGAFLDPRWRENDILWGRLDGAERIVAALAATAKEADNVNIDVESTQNAAFECILAERRGETPAAPGPASPARVRPREAIAAEVKHLTSIADLPADKTLTLLGRSTAVIRKLVGGVAEQRNADKNVVIVWALRLLSVIWGVVEAAVPRSTIQLLVRYWLNLVMISGALLVGVGYLLDRSGEMVIGAGLIVGAAAVRLVIQGITSAAARPSPRARWSWLIALSAAGAVSAGLAMPHAAIAVDGFSGWDFQFAHDHDRLATIFATCSDSCQAAVSQAIWFDFWYLASYGVGLCALALLVRRCLLALGSHATASVAKKLASAAVIAALADAVENAGMLTTLARQLWKPLEDMQGPDPFFAHLVPAATYASSMVKWSLVACATVGTALSLVLGSAAALVRKIKRSFAPRGAVAPAVEPRRAARPAAVNPLDPPPEAGVA
jgi:patatin-related protein